MLSHTLYEANGTYATNAGDVVVVPACADVEEEYTLNGYWAWPFDDKVRGTASVLIEIDCGCDGPDCEIEGENYEVVENMQLGSAKAKCEFCTDRFGTRRAAVGVGLATCTADVDISIDVEAASITVSAHGLGTSLKKSHTGLDIDCKGTCPIEIEAQSNIIWR
ncbi:MAG: hypothetical protein GY780_09665 [bacterium]|nr:hypothetical protein [bacterium]